LAQHGWVKEHRKEMDSLVWANPYQFKLWRQLIMLANHQDSKVIFNGKSFDVSSGQLVTGRDALAFIYNKGAQPVHQKSARLLWKWVKKFEEWQMLTISSTARYSVITITNYSKYQQGDQLESISGPSKVQLKSTNKNDKNEENEKKSTIYSPVVDYLNQKAGTKYKSSGKKTQSLINARVKDGFKLDDFKKVIDNKTAEWQGTDMEQYLRPETLFGTKFEGYLNQKPVKSKQRQNFTQNNDQYSNLGW